MLDVKVQNKLEIAKMSNPTTFPNVKEKLM
jgi:hypothetical protein